MGYVSKVKIDSGGEMPIVSSLYGTCSTGGGTAAKVVTCTDFDACRHGVTIRVKFDYTNTASSPTLNINGTGAHDILLYGTTKVGTTVATSWSAGEVVSLTFDQGYNAAAGGWYVDNYLNTNTDTHNTAYLYAGTSSGSANASATNPYLILKDGSSVTSRVQLAASGQMSISSNASGVVTFKAPIWKVANSGNAYTGTGTACTIASTEGTVTDICIMANINNGGVWVSVNIPGAMLTTTNSGTFRAGYFQNSTNGGAAYFTCSSRSINLNLAYLNGATVTSTTKWYVYYKCY